MAARLGLLALLASAAPARAGAPEVRVAIEQVMAAKGLGPPSGPGCAVSVWSQDRPLFEAGYGGADLDQGTSFSLLTVSETGSVAKQFTAAEILILAEDGKLSLEDDIRRYLPEMPDYGARIRIYDLLHQQSGIREWATLAALRGYPRFHRKIYQMPELLRLVSGQRELNFTPGTRYEYSNSNYGLLTIIVERVSGQPARTFAEQRLFGPLGMTSTQWRDNMRRVTPHRAIAYRRTGAGYEQAMPLEEIYGHGALLTTVGDLQIWNRAILTGRLSPFATQQMLAPARLADGQTRTYGGGVIVTSHRGHRVYRHGGTTAGYTAQLWNFPDDRVSIAVLCNVQIGDMGEIAVKAADAALGLGPAPAPVGGPPVPAIAPPADAPSVYFRSPQGEVIAVRYAAGKTWVDLFDRKGFGLLVPAGPGGGLTTAAAGAALDLRFDGPHRIVAGLDGREPQVFSRAPAARSAPPPLGRYVNADLPATYKLSRVGGILRLDLADRLADDPLGFDLQPLAGDTYLARVRGSSVGFRDDVFVTLTPATGRRPPGLAISSVMGFQGVDRLRFVLSRAP